MVAMIDIYLKGAKDVGVYTVISGIGTEYDHKKIAKTLVQWIKPSPKKYRVNGKKILILGDNVEEITRILIYLRFPVPHKLTQHGHEK
jgi:translation initiation factor 1 (eIF-1/SUI1)